MIGVFVQLSRDPADLVPDLHFPLLTMTEVEQLVHGWMKGREVIVVAGTGGNGSVILNFGLFNTAYIATEPGVKPVIPLTGSVDEILQHLR